MDLRDLLNKLDSLTEDDELSAAQNANATKWDFAHKKEHLFSLLTKLRDVVNAQGGPKSSPAPASTPSSTPATTTTPTAPPGGGGSTTSTSSAPSSDNVQALRDRAAELMKAGDPARAKIYTDTANRLSTGGSSSSTDIHTELDKLSDLDPNVKYAKSLRESLIESFGYESVNEEGAWDTIKGGLKKLALPITAAVEIWDAWQKIKALPADMPTETKKVEITKIIGKQVAEFGVFVVGAAIGGIIGGAIAGPVGIVTALAGGVAANYAFDNDVDKLVDWIVASLYQPNSSTGLGDVPNTGGTPADTGSTAQEVNLDELMKKVTREVQTNLKAAGFDLGIHDIDGMFGPDTMAALKSFKQQANADSDLGALLQLIDLGEEEEEEVKEAININTAEGLASLRDMLLQLDEIRFPWKPKIPKVSEPKPTEPKPTEPKPTEPKPTEPKVSEPKPEEPKAAEPKPEPEKVKKDLETKSPKIKSAFDSLKKLGQRLGTLWRFSKFVALIAALAAAGYYLWDNEGNITGTDAPSSDDDSNNNAPAAPAAPGGGGSTTPAQQQGCSKEIEELVSQIRLDITQLKMFNDPEISPDAKKAIDHAEKTLSLYAPGC